MGKLCPCPRSFLFLSIFIITHLHCNSLQDDYGTCNNSFTLFKNTQASSHSAREYENAFKIFPYIRDEGANKFQDGLCAYQSKLQLPDTCFSIHAPQTMEKDSGLLKIEILEKKMTEKWKHSLSPRYKYEYDAFMDYNMGFWVKSLDEYIVHWQKFKPYALYAQNEGKDAEKEPETLNKLEYIGIEWDIDINYKNMHFYSLLIHSPFSAINYEFMSQTKPSNALYDGIKWIKSDIARCTFKAMNNPYPWDRKDAASIVPVRLSHAVSDIGQSYDFYINIMGAQLLFNSYQFKTDIDAQTIETFSVSLIGAQIELQFIKRPSFHTSGDFTVGKYEQLLMETHLSIVSNAYCGTDRWFDNHFGYKTYGIKGYMDTMIKNLNQRRMLYRVYKLPYEHSSVLMKKELDKWGFPTQYGAIVVAPTGQTIEVNGWISDPTMQRMAPVANPQWCSTECNGNMRQGVVNPSHVYVDNEDYTQGYTVDVVGPFDMDKKQSKHGHQSSSPLYILFVVGGVVFISMFSIVAMYYFCCCELSHFENEKMNGLETTPLMWA